jgi:DNA polymerase-3 subunit gamma/tau
MQLLHPVQETMINNMKSEIVTFIREKLKNNSIILTAELMKPDETKKMIYTNREKLEHLMEKNPLLKELKDRLSLDTDF